MAMAVPKLNGDDLADLSIMDDIDVTTTTASTSATMTVVTTTSTTPSTTATLATSGMIVQTSATAGMSGTSGTPLGAHLLSCIESMTLNINQPQYDWNAPSQHKEFRVFQKQMNLWYFLHGIRNFMALMPYCPVLEKRDM